MNNINEIVQKLGNKKKGFLDSVESAINSHISNRSWQDCLTIVLRNTDGNISSTWYPSEVMSGYTPRFISFLRKKKYNGYAVDSVLTDDIVQLVTNKFSSFYKDNTECISKSLLDQLLKDHIFVEQLSKQMIEISNGTLPSAVKSQMTSAIIHHLEKTLNVDITDTCGHIITTSTSHIVAFAAALPISKAMVAVMAKSLAVSMKTVIAKVLASTAMKTMMMTAVKKIVVAKILAATITLVGAHLGGISIAWIIAPLLLAFITYEVSNLPSKMGKKVSEAVRIELNGEFDNINTNIVQQIVSSFSTSIIGTLASDIANNEEIKELLKNGKEELISTIMKPRS
ncbi:MAG: hypothetical protein NC388_07535 [Clostridium sp.]|nr:hypothetical protein [Clostridium sp.]